MKSFALSLAFLMTLEARKLEKGPFPFILLLGKKCHTLLCILKQVRFTVALKNVKLQPILFLDSTFPV